MCRSQRKAEALCNDGVDNDTDGVADCQDPDCVGFASETNCTDGLDDNCNGLVDCADSACGGAACASLAIGKPCSASTQCASGTCLTELAKGWPSGSCVGAANGCSLDAGVSVGCPSGSACLADQFKTLRQDGEYRREEC